MKNKGFTLIELLVVVAIIGILAAVVIASLNSAQASARDAQRLQDIRSIQNAFELYYLENGTYPNTVSIASGIAGSDLHNAVSSNTSWDTLETSMGVTLPRDPINNLAGDDLRRSGEYAYFYRNLHSQLLYCYGQAYQLRYKLEKDSSGGGIVLGCNGGTMNPSGGVFLVGMSPVE